MSTPDRNLRIQRSTYLEDLVRAYPGLVVFLAEKGVVCIKCGTVSWDTVEEAARKADIDDIDALVTELQDLAVASTAGGH